LSITTHLALLSARLPKLKSELDEDPLFDDDWQASAFLYPYNSKGVRVERPSITLVVIVVGSNFIFDPSKEELAAADTVLAVSVGSSNSKDATRSSALGILSIRTIDPPSRLSTAGVPNSLNTTTGETTTLSVEEAFAAREVSAGQPGVWNVPRGGVKRALLGKIIKTVLDPGGVAEEVMEGLVAVQS
jgi:exosome complex component RRP42